MSLDDRGEKQKADGYRGTPSGREKLERTAGAVLKENYNKASIMTVLKRAEYKKSVGIDLDHNEEETLKRKWFYIRMFEKM